MKLTIAMVQPRRVMGAHAREKNLKMACGYLDEAVAGGAKIVCFPESYPGPSSAAELFYPEETLGERAARHGVYVIAGGMEPVADRPDHSYVCMTLIGPDGAVQGRYRRTTPPAPWVYKNGLRIYNINYATGDELPVFDTVYGKIGILICSEVYPPELARVLALKGAEIIFLPNGTSRKSMRETWGTLIKARAYENLAYTATCKNVIEEDDGFAMVAGPSKALLFSTQVGVHIAQLDLGHARWLRAQQETEETFRDWPHGVKPGLLTQWRRPELYGPLVQKPRP